MSSPNTFSLLSSFVTSSKPSRLSESSVSDGTPSHHDDKILQVTYASQPVPAGSQDSRPNEVSSVESSSVPCSRSPPSGNDELWRSPPQQRVRGMDLAELKATGLFHQRDQGPLLASGQSVPNWVLHSKELREHTFHDTPTSIGTSGGVPVYVMLPLDTISINNTLNRRRALNASLAALKSAGVEGIMMDVWWGVVEKNNSMDYNWSAYRELIEVANKHDLKVQAVMSFHQCGGNVGDNCTVPLPEWVVEEIDRNPDLVYTDKAGTRNYEYLSLGCDTLPVLGGRSPVQVYSDYMRSFRDEFRDFMGETVVEIQVGMGPAGELRYPSYPETNGRWKFPGIGEFQCYDKYMLANLKVCAEVSGNTEWGLGGPAGAGHYCQWPDETDFFRKDGAWNSPYGQFFLKWYSDMLLGHGERVLSAAATIFRGSGAYLSGKVAGIHWHYGTRSHAPELTAGYYNTRYRDGYIEIARTFARHGVTFNFTCIEMKDSEQPPYALCSPEGLLRQVAAVSKKASIRLAGENALPRFDKAAHDQIVQQSRLHLDVEGVDSGIDEPMCSFTYLRMCETLFQPENWRTFVPFVRHMGEGRTYQPWEDEHQDTHSHVDATRGLTQEAEHLMYH